MELGLVSFMDRRRFGSKNRTMDNGSHQVLARKPCVCERSSGGGRDLRRKVVIVVVLAEGSVGDWRLAK